MKLKLTFYLLIFFISISTFCFAQNNSPATSKRASLLSSTFSFTSQNGDLFEFADNKVTTLTITAGYLNFVANKFGVGANLGITRLSAGGDTYTEMDIGPKATYFFDNGSNGIPYLGIGLSYLLIDFGDFGENKEQGMRNYINGGFLIRKGHVAFIAECGFQFDSYGQGDNGHVIYMAVGIAASLYPDAE